MQTDGIASTRRRYQCSVDMRHRGQINEVEVPLPIELKTAAKGSKMINPEVIESLIEAFYNRYETIYGKGSSYKDARLEIVSFRVRAMADTQRPDLPRSKPVGKAAPKSARTGMRSVYFDERSKSLDTTIYNGAALKAGNHLAGPCIIETTDTTIVVRPGQSLRVDGWSNFELHLDAVAGQASERNKAPKGV